MIISRTPVRISFVGGGSDIASYYSKNAGAVVAATINKYIYITVNKKFDNNIRVSYSKTEIVSNASQVKHPLIRECLKKVGISGGVEITSISDIPSDGTGLGSSSSYTVGLLNALYAFKGKYISASQLAKESCEIEINVLNGSMGKQDQYMAAFGGLQYFQFFPNEVVENQPIINTSVLLKKLEKNLLLFYTGTSRVGNSILKKQSENIRKLPLSREYLDRMVHLSEVMMQNLMRNNLKTFGELLDENWQLKKKLAKEISNTNIDRWYNTAKRNGALGGKILGAGGGGFLLIYAHSNYHKKIINALKNLKKIDFSFETQGTKIIFVN